MEELLRSAEVAFSKQKIGSFAVFFFFSQGSNKNGGLVGGCTNPSEKYAPQIGSSPQVGMNIKNTWNHRPGVQIV